MTVGKIAIGKGDYELWIIARNKLLRLSDFARNKKLTVDKKQLAIGKAGSWKMEVGRKK